MVFGTYLYVCVNFLGVHYNEAFSSLKIENYKHIVRLHINKEGQCELYALGIDKVPKKWIRLVGDHLACKTFIPNQYLLVLLQR